MELKSWIHSYILPMFHSAVFHWDDYFHYHEGVRRFLADPHTLYLGASKSSLVGFLYPPLSVLFFAPFYKLPERIAYVLCGLIIYATTAAAVYLIGSLYEQVSGETLSKRCKAGLLVIALSFTPTLHNVMFSQVNTVVLLLCLTYIWGVLNGHEFWGGLVLAAAIWLKLYPALLLFLVVQDRRYGRSLPGVLCGIVLPPFILSGIVPLYLYKEYFLDFLPVMSSHTIVHVMNQSLPAVLARLHLPPAAWQSWDSVKVGFYDNQIVRVFLALVLLRLWKIRGSQTLVFESALCAAIPLVIGLGWGYTYFLVLPLAIVSLILSMREERLWPQVAVCLAFLAFVFPSYKMMPMEPHFPIIFRTLYYSRYCLAVLVFLSTSLHLIETPQTAAEKSDLVLAKTTV
jgi:hypothetical protein